jgi:carboxyl-terminal processing protease
VFAGGPGDKAGLNRGDKVLAADGVDFDPLGSFLGKAGQAVALTVERQRGDSPTEIRVTPRKIDPGKEWLEAQQNGSRVNQRDGKTIAYVPMFSCAGEEYVSALQDAILDKFRDAAALILDFRDGWGGCSPDFVNLFNPTVPVTTYIDRRGEKRTMDMQWRKPLYLLINGRSRSGKEEVAFASTNRRQTRRRFTIFAPYSQLS